MLKTTAIIFKTEIIALFRRSFEWLYPLAFFCMVMVFFPLALTPNINLIKPYIPGLIWIAILFANFLTLQTFFVSDIEDGYLEQWMMSSYPLSLLCSAKLFSQWCITQIPILLLLPFTGWLFQLDLHSLGWLMLSVAIGTPIVTMLGALCLALSLGLRQQGAMLGLLIMPLITPVLIFGAEMHTFSVCILLSGITCLSIFLLPSAIAMALKISVAE